MSSKFQLGESLIQVYSRVFQSSIFHSALVFILDASTFQKDIQDTAEFLYTILTDDVVLSHKLPLLVVCNKQDLISAKSSSIIKMGLEKELLEYLIF